MPQNPQNTLLSQSKINILTPEDPFVWQRKWFRWVLIIVAWTLLGFLAASQFYLAASRVGRPIPWLWALSLELIYAYSWVLLTPVIFWLGRQFRIEKQKLVRTILLHLFIGAFMGFAMRVFHDAMLYYYIVDSEEPITLISILRRSFSLFDYGILTYWVLLMVQWTTDYNRRYREGTLKASQLETQLAHAQLQALKMQLQPHFLFNTLNSISALLYKDIEAADRMIARLGKLFRLSLDNSRAQLVSLQQELDFVRCYLDIEEIRFQERLKVEKDIEPEANNALMPNLLLQPIVENAIKHGISSQTGPGLIKISARCELDRLLIVVEDNGPGLPPDESSGIVLKQGFGLTNIQTRLEQLYGDDFVFELENSLDGGLLVSFDLPLLYENPR